MKNIISKIILIQFIGCVFLIQGIQNLYFSTQNEKYECILKYYKKQKSDYSKILNLTNEAGLFVVTIFLWFFNWYSLDWYNKLEKKRHILNTVLTTILLFSLLFYIFRNEYVSFAFRQLGKLFSENFGIQNLINGIIFTIFGSLILWKSYKVE